MTLPKTVVRPYIFVLFVLDWTQLGLWSPFLNQSSSIGKYLYITCAYRRIYFGLTQEVEKFNIADISCIYQS